MNQSLACKVIDTLKSEIAKNENKTRLGECIEPIVWHSIKGLYPFVAVLFLILVVVLVQTSLILYKVFKNE